MLDLSKSSSVNSSIITNGYSDNTLEWGNICVSELNACDVPLNSRLCYIRKIDGYFHLFYSIKDLGYLSNKNDGTDVNFKRFLTYLRNDIGEDFHCVVFPCVLEGYPYINKFVVYKTEEAFKPVLEQAVRKAKVVAYNDNGTMLSLSNFAFNLTGGDSERYNKVKNLMLGCKGSASNMVKKLDISGIGYVGWVSVKDDFFSQKVKHKDTLGNVRYLEVIL